MATVLSSYDPLILSPSLSPGVVSQQDNGKTFSVSSTIRIPVERKDNGAALSCEAFHPALGGQKRIRHYRLDVYCKSLFQTGVCLCMCVCLCTLYAKAFFYPSRKQMNQHNVHWQISQTHKLFHLYFCHLSCAFCAIHSFFFFCLTLMPAIILSGVEQPHFSNGRYLIFRMKLICIKSRIFNRVIAGAALCETRSH